MVLDGDDSSSDMEEDAHNFELKSRSIPDERLEPAMLGKGRVRRAVEVLEYKATMKLFKTDRCGLAGMEHAQDGVMSENLHLNVYGSNNGHLVVRSRKRALQEPEDDLGQDPPPKRQFTEEAEKTEEVEVANPEWL
ncbi:unnamed protein product [Linum trigynum]|uniref:Uncharacterized protein n=1 Tax=Linum trigynum TaxID=586398 RepID=A0AAV2EBU1_9ROSI